VNVVRFCDVSPRRRFGDIDADENPSRTSTDRTPMEEERMKTPVTAVLAVLLLGGCATALPQSGGLPQSGSGYESAAVPNSIAGRWQGTAVENFGYHGGAASARMTLDLNPDGTWTQTWIERGRTMSESGRWVMQGRSVVLESSEGLRRRVTLRRQGDGLYGAIDQSWLGGRNTPMTIEFHRSEADPK
jgi:hypothetical protein